MKEKQIRPRLSEEQYIAFQKFIKESYEQKPNESNDEYSYQENGEGAWVEGYKITSLDQLLKTAKVDLNVWEVERYIINKWDVTMGAKGTGNGAPGVKTNFQVKAWLKKKTGIIDYAKFKKELIDDVKSYSPVIIPVNYDKYIEDTDNNMLEPNIYDLHLGKLAWALETGGDNYDTKIAVETCMHAMNFLLTSATAHYKFSKVLLTVGNDLFNSDREHPFPQTTKGTPQESDLRWQKVFQIGRRLMFDIVAMCKTVAPVEIVVMPGNHDHQKMFYLGEVLDAMYFNDPNVTVDNSPLSKKYKEFGQCLIGLAHGKNESVKSMLQLMPQQAKEAWARTKYREWHVGDKHHNKSVEAISSEDYNGIVIRYMTTLMENDSWEALNCYTGGIKGASAYVWNYNKGNIATFNYNK
jgi:hypothetical protein